MPANKSMVEKYMDGCRKSDQELILSCLADDRKWEMPGALHLLGKEAFDKAIENAAFVGSATITITPMMEENDVVVAEGSVRTQSKASGLLSAVFCHVCIMPRGKSKRMTTYGVEVK
jgi:uncharacterized protein